MLAYVFIGLAVAFVAAYFLTRKRVVPKEQIIDSKESNSKTEKINYGPLNIFYGSQTGTAAKLSEQLAEEATDEGFEPQVIDLKDVNINHFEVMNTFT